MAWILIGLAAIFALLATLAVLEYLGSSSADGLAFWRMVCCTASSARVLIFRASLAIAARLDARLFFAGDQSVL